MMVSAVRRGYTPGAHSRLCVILQGAQNAGKSTFIKKLFGEGFVGGCSKPKLDDRDGFFAINRHWAFEFAEIDVLLSSYRSGEVKDFISSPEATYRTLFTENTKVYKRTGIVIGTTNRTDFLRDETGSDRFCVIKMPDQFNKTGTEGEKNVAEMLKMVAEMREEIIASAIYGYQNGESGEVGGEYKQQQAQTNQDYEEVDEWSTIVEETVKGYEFIEVLAVAEKLGIDVAHFDRRSSSRLHKILKRLGYASKSVYVEGQTRRCWVNRDVGGGLYFDRF
jgi:predicted P-loop ATPase